MPKLMDKFIEIKNPEPKDLQKLALSYYRAAQELDKAWHSKKPRKMMGKSFGGTPPFPIYFLIAHSLELCFKGFIFYKKKEVPKIHDLMDLLSLCEGFD